MIFNKKTGRIAFHSCSFNDDGEVIYTQFDYDGTKLDRELDKHEEIVLMGNRFSNSRRNH